MYVCMKFELIGVGCCVPGSSGTSVTADPRENCRQRGTRYRAMVGAVDRRNSLLLLSLDQTHRHDSCFVGTIIDVVCTYTGCTTAAPHQLSLALACPQVPEAARLFSKYYNAAQTFAATHKTLVSSYTVRDRRMILFVALAISLLFTSG